MRVELASNQIVLSDVAAATCGVLQGADCACHTICTDSGEAKPYGLFVALRGERTDGHRYMTAALEAGCRAFLCEYIPDDMADAAASFVIVADTYAALSHLAQAHLQDKALCRIAVTGSVGKTTTKEFLVAVLSQRFKTYKTEANYNSTVGMPLAALGVTFAHEAAVFEMGMGDFGEISLLSQTVRPQIAVITKIGSSHLQKLGTRQGIARAKLEILDGLQSGGVLICDGDEPLLDIQPNENYIVVRVSMQGQGAICGENIRVLATRGQTVFDVRTPRGSMTDVCIPTAGRHMVQDALYAIAVGLQLGLSEQEIRRGLLCYQSIGLRQHCLTLGSIHVIEDCYNASPESMREALTLLSAMAKETGGRAIAVLGDMRELGTDAEALHRALGAFLVEQGISLLLCLGELGAWIADGAQASGMSPDDILRFASLDELETAADALCPMLRPNDAVLIKASRGVAAERFSQALSTRLCTE